MESTETREEKRIRTRNKKRLRRKRERRIIIMIFVSFLLLIGVVLSIGLGGNKKNNANKETDNKVTEILNPEDPKVQLNFLLQKAESKERDKYSTASVEVLEQRCEEAKEVLNDSKSTKEEIEEASINLLLAMQRLEEMK